MHSITVVVVPDCDWQDEFAVQNFKLSPETVKALLAQGIKTLFQIQA